MADRRMLNQQADRIEALLAQHRLPAQVVGGTVTPRTVRFNINLAPQVKLSKLMGLSEELALVLGAVSCRIQRIRDTIQIEVPHDGAQRLAFADLCAMLERVPPGTVALGMDTAGQPLLLRLSSPAIAHVLVCGTTGSGKTALVRTMLFSLTRFNQPRDLGFALIDPKRRGFSCFAQQKHLLSPLAVTTDQAADLLQRLVAEMEKRDASGHHRPRIVVAIDELADLLQTGRERIEQPLTRLLQRGREAGIHVLACTQKPSAAVLSGLLRANFPTRLVGKVASAEDARIASGIAGTGAEKLAGRGEFLLIAAGQTIRFQSAWLSTEEIEASNHSHLNLAQKDGRP
jgi:DNA segregation ATPase FtsK/SpoIIIE, S-DNA-T family